MTSRDLTAGMQTEVQAASLRPVVFFEGEFASAQYLRLWTGIGQITWNSQTWTGGGNLLSISPLEEKDSVEAIGFTVTISGLPSASISLALGSVRQGLPGKLWLGMLNAAGSIIADPYLAAQGKFDVAVVEDAGDTCTISAAYESRLIDLQRPRQRHYTHEDQQIDYSGDLGFEYVASLQDKELIWGGPGAAASPVAQPTGPVQSDSDSVSRRSFGD